MVNVHVTEFPEDAYDSFDRFVEVLKSIDPYVALKTLSLELDRMQDLLDATDAAVLSQKRDEFKTDVKADLPSIKSKLGALQDSLGEDGEDVTPIRNMRNGLTQMNTFLKQADNGDPVWLGTAKTVCVHAMKLSDGDGNPLQEEVDSPADITMQALAGSLDEWRKRLDEKGEEASKEERDVYKQAGEFALNAYLYITSQKAIISQRMDQALNRTGGRSIGGDDNDDGNGGSDIPPTFKFPGT